MKLVYKATGQPVAVGDKVTMRDGKVAEVQYFRPPHKPSSEGKVTVTPGWEYFVSVIGAEWIEREDRL